MTICLRWTMTTSGGAGRPTTKSSARRWPSWRAMPCSPRRSPWSPVARSRKEAFSALSWRSWPDGGDCRRRVHRGAAHRGHLWRSGWTGLPDHRRHPGCDGGCGGAGQADRCRRAGGSLHLPRGLRAGAIEKPRRRARRARPSGRRPAGIPTRPARRIGPLLRGTKDLSAVLREIHSLAELRALPEEALPALCEELRSEIISICGKVGGHLGASLGAVELIVALHRVFKAPTDAIVFDVGHQAYAHKILTGRFDRMQTLRQAEGVAPFLDPTDRKS